MRYIAKKYLYNTSFGQDSDGWNRASEDLL